MLNNIVTILTFPGVIVHEWAHKTMCELFGVKVHKVVYFSLLGRNNGYVLHDEPNNYAQVFGISVGPLFFNSLLTVISTIIAVQFFREDFLYYFLLWLAFSIGMHAFPSNGDAKNLMNYSKNVLKKWYNPLNWFHLLTFPLVFLIWIMNELKIFWLDAAYSFLLIYVTIINI
ncbi:MAG: metalloprotease family protein [Candidatus Pacebacteria bacterium]|nr:metalloprotease family protein [Candidatus Paceibacterota bacterium]MDD3919448.1 metalloprotease family protein [Candidatus Paceibacterota bacterium]